MQETAFIFLRTPLLHGWDGLLYFRNVIENYVEWRYGPCIIFYGHRAGIFNLLSLFGFEGMALCMVYYYFI